MEAGIASYPMSSLQYEGRMQGCPSIHKLPTELIDTVTDGLDLPDISNLRLTCHDMGRRAAGPRFMGQFHHETTDLSGSSLARLAAIAAHPVFGLAIKRLTVVATVYFADWIGKPGHPGLTELQSDIETGKKFTQEELNNRIETSREKSTQGGLENDSEIGQVFTQEVLEGYRKDLEFISDRRAEQALSELEDHVPVITQLAAIMRTLGKLDSINVTGGVVSRRKGHGRALSSTARNLWSNAIRRAGQVFYITTMAMARGGLQTRVFQILETTKRCSIPNGTDVKWLLSEAATEQMASAVNKIKVFAVSFAPLGGTGEDLVFGPSYEPNGKGQVQGLDCPRDGQTAVPAQGGSDGGNKDVGDGSDQNSHPAPSFVEPKAIQPIPRLLGMMHDLEALDLHLYDPRIPMYIKHSYKDLFPSLTQNAHFPRLQKLIIRGLFVTSSSLVQFLDKHSSHLRHLELRHIRISTGCGEWDPVFRQLNHRTMPRLEYLLLDSLSDPSGWLVNLIGPRMKPEDESDPSLLAPANPRTNLPEHAIRYLPYWGRRSFVLVREFFGPQEREEEELKFTAWDMSQQLWSPWARWWDRDRRAEYGPLESGDDDSEYGDEGADGDIQE